MLPFFDKTKKVGDKQLLPPGHGNNYLTRTFWLFAGAWTLVVIISLSFNIFHENNEVKTVAIAEARAHFEKDQAFRFWGASHGGVYVVADEKTPPNPYLAHLPDRDIIMPSGKRLTLMNPAYMIRQMNENFAELYGVKGHITSLRPLRPENKPDVWERAALETFERGNLEELEFTEIDGEPYLRLMHPMVTRKSCLKCHSHQGYKEGDIRGGVSISLPVETLTDIARKDILLSFFRHGTIWLLGLFGLGVWSKRRAEDNAARSKAEAESIRSSQMALLGELAAGVAHEINNPINGIINYSQIIANSSSPGTREHDVALRIIKEGDRIADIVGNLLSFARRPGEEKHSINVRKILSEVISLTGTQIKKDNIRINIRIASKLSEINVFSQKIEQVFLNIISNARYALNRKFPDAADVKMIEIAMSETVIEGVGFLKIVFYDNGTGVNKRDLDNVMLPFYSTKPSGEGTGLGLSISQGIINDHGGTIDIESVEGEFTRVTILLPVNIGQA